MAGNIYAKHTATVIRGACKSFVKTFEIQTLLELADKIEAEAEQLRKEAE